MKKEPKFLRVNNSIIFVYVLLITFIYRKLYLASFQQDEWYVLAQFLMNKGLSIFGMIKLFTKDVNYFPRPFSYFFALLNFKCFGIHYSYYYYCSIISHIAVTISIYFLAQLLTKNRVIAFITGLFFAVNSTCMQNITWISAYFGSPQAAFFTVWSLFFYFKYMSEAKRQTKFQYLSLGCLLIAILFKETAAHLFIMLPVMHLIFSKKRKFFSYLKSQIPLLLTLLGFLIIYFSPLFFKISGSAAVQQVSNTGNGKFAVLLYRLMTIPLTTLVDIFIHPTWLYWLGAMVTRLGHPYFFNQQGTTTYNMFAETAGVNIATFYLAFVIMMIIFCLLKYLKKYDRKLFDAFLICFIFVITSGFPLILAYSVSFAVLESRYLYIPVLGGSFMAATLVYIIGIKLSKLIGGENRFRKGCVRNIVIIFFAVGFCWINITMINHHIEGLVHISKIRNSITESIETSLSIESNRIFIYTESNRAYYGKAEHILPFQCGAGYQLLTCHSMSNPKFIKLLKDDSMWDIVHQGVVSEEDVVFGYFRDYSLFKSAIKEWDIKPEEIYAFSWDGNAEVLDNITPIQREQLRDITSYISKDNFENSVNLGSPDGITYQFLNKSFMICPVERVINLKNNKEWFFCDLKKGQKRMNIKNSADYYLTYKYGLEPTYSGTMLVYHAKGNGTNKYVIPEYINGRQVSGFQFAVFGEGQRADRIVQKENGDFVISFPDIHHDSEALECGLFINDMILYYTLGEGVNAITEGVTVNTKGDGVNKQFKIKLKGELKTLRSYWQTNELRYQPKAFIDGEMTQIESWSGIDTKFLEVVFKEPPIKDAIIKIPVLIVSAPKSKDSIKITNYIEN